MSTLAQPMRSPRSVVVLVADDTRDTREMYAEYLTYSGYTVLEAADVQLALQHRPDVIVLDLSMPRIDGWAMATMLKADERTKQAKLIAVSGHALKGSDQRARSAGCDAYIAKPCLPEQLATEIERQTGSGTASRAP